MTPDYYLSQLKIYSRFVRNFNPAQQDKDQMLKIAVGPGGDEPRFAEWTETIMKAWQHHQWSWDMNGLSMHNYTVVSWPPTYTSVGFGEAEYSQILKPTLADGRSDRQAFARSWTSTIPQKKIALVVDEWGAWYAPLPGSNPGLPGPAEQHARRHSGRAEPEHLRPSCRPRAHGQHRADDQRAAGDDPDGQGEDGPDADLPRLQNVCAVPGRDVRAGHLRCGHATRTATSPCRASTRSPPRMPRASCGSPSPISIPISRLKSRRA